MKLYAKVSSERATKKQGGNKYLRFELLGGSKDFPKLLYILNFTPNKIRLSDNYGNTLFEDKRDMLEHLKYLDRTKTSPQDVIDEYNRETKGKKRKSEEPDCLHNYQDDICKTCGWVKS